MSDLSDLDKAEEVDALEDVDVTSWEAEFLDNTLPALRAGRVLSPKQHATLDTIYKKYCC